MAQMEFNGLQKATRRVGAAAAWHWCVFSRRGLQPGKDARWLRLHRIRKARLQGLQEMPPRRGRQARLACVCVCARCEDARRRRGPYPGPSLPLGAPLPRAPRRLNAVPGRRCGMFREDTALGAHLEGSPRRTGSISQQWRLEIFNETAMHGCLHSRDRQTDPVRFGPEKSAPAVICKKSRAVATSSGFPARAPLLPLRRIAR